MTSVEQPGTFLGYPREQGAAGTRNHVVLMATSSRSSGFVTELARRFDGAAAGDGVVPVAHTEGGEDEVPNNLHFLLATLAGFTLNPNVGAVLIVDTEDDVVSGQAIKDFMAEHDYPSIKVPHAFFTRQAGFEHDLTAAGALVEPWLPIVDNQTRTEVPLADLKIALQCGGSDAFSGISANPLAGLVGAEVIKHGGTAVLAETDELIGAEPYVLKNVRDLADRESGSSPRSARSRNGSAGTATPPRATRPAATSIAVSTTSCSSRSAPPASCRARCGWTT